jgi:hypothetical protein
MREVYSNTVNAGDCGKIFSFGGKEARVREAIGLQNLAAPECHAVAPMPHGSYRDRQKGEPQRAEALATENRHGSPVELEAPMIPCGCLRQLIFLPALTVAN